MNENKTENCKLRAMLIDDLATILAWRNDPEVRRYMFNQNAITESEHLRWFERVIQDRCKQLLIFEIDDQAFGFVAFTRLADGGTADWGFYAAPDAPKGAGRKMGRVALDHAFTHMGLHKVCGQVLADNARSLRFHRALSFRQEDMLCDQRFDGQRFHHVICFGLSRLEWQANQ